MLSNKIANSDEDLIPYSLPQVPFMSSDMVHTEVLGDWLNDDQLWVPQTPQFHSSPAFSLQATDIS